MYSTKIEPKYKVNSNSRVGLITLATDFRIEKDFNTVSYTHLTLPTTPYV